MRFPVSAWIALPTMSEHRRYARFVQPVCNLARVEHMHRDLRRLLDDAQGTSTTGAIPVMGRGIVEQQWRQRQAGPWELLFSKRGHGAVMRHPWFRQFGGCGPTKQNFYFYSLTSQFRGPPGRMSGSWGVARGWGEFADPDGLSGDRAHLRHRCFAGL